MIADGEVALHGGPPTPKKFAERVKQHELNVRGKENAQTAAEITIGDQKALLLLSDLLPSSSPACKYYLGIKFDQLSALSNRPKKGKQRRTFSKEDQTVKMFSLGLVYLLVSSISE